MDLTPVQAAIKAKAEAEYGLDSVFEVDFPDALDEPTTNGVMDEYVVLRFNSPNPTAGDESFGGARHDGRYTLVDMLAVGATPSDAINLAYGPGGLTDTFNGFKPTDDAGEMKDGGGTVFVRAGDSSSKPRRFIAHVSFRVPVNLLIDG
jgi:hypothetical protein